VRACVESIIRFTDISQAEIILVANGAPEETRQLASEFHLKLLWSNEAIGYTRACNEGMKLATGDYVIPFNDDCVVLGPEWINMMLAPFDDPQMGITGPLMLHCPDAQRDFLVGFCFMVKRELLAAAGYYDETFSPGYGEDCDLCCKVVDAGWKIVQVPVGEQNHLMDKGVESDLPDWKKDRMWVSSFPLYHDGNQTFGKDPEAFDVILRRNRVVLQERYRKVNTPSGLCERCNGPLLDDTCVGAENKLNCDGLYLWRASVIDGWFSVCEMEFLAKVMKSEGKFPE
jgi:GT2 family glycosyltransferase